MYISVQKIYGKSKIYGYPKDVVTTKTSIGTTIYYGWAYSEEKFERENYSYKIIVKESYREKGKVKQRQAVIGTYHWFKFINQYVLDNEEEIRLKLAAIFKGKTEEEFDSLYKKIEEKIRQIESIESKKWMKTEEYKTHNQQLDLIDQYNASKRAFDKIYGEGYFEQIYDVHLNIMNQTILDQCPLLKEEKRKKDEEKRKEFERKEKEREDFFKKFSGSSYRVGFSSNYTEKEKAFLKKFYHVLAAKFHPDVIKDNEPMQLLNQLKEQWGI